MNATDIDVVHGRVFIEKEWCTFELIEAIYEEIQPHLQKRQEAKLAEGESWSNIKEKK